MRPSPFYMFVGIISQPLKWLFRLRAEGLENVPQNGGFVLAANHLSNFDPWPLGLPLFPKRYLRFMAKAELFWWPMGPVISSGGAFKVRRGEGDLAAMNKAVDLVREGHAVVMFPHGTRQRKGIVKKHQPRSHTGAARIALEVGAPLVPAAIAGTDRLSRLGPLRVRYGKPIDLDGLDARAATQRLMAEIERLSEEL
ncbi:MAG TPA: lysophospholipid acyltransferase family protein [Gaiellaceae bacterium]